jgi:MOSC domain-containing protein YiiM
MGQVTALFVAPDGSAPVAARQSVDAVPGGIRGDRYLAGTGYYAPFDVCAVTFVESEALARVREADGIDLDDGRHRRNVVTSGVSLRDLLGAEFRVGGARFRGTRPRPPCGHLERIAEEPGLARALRDGRGGICADVLSPGTIRVGDSVTVTTPTPREVGRQIADRLRRGAGEDRRDGRRHGSPEE